MTRPTAFRTLTWQATFDAVVCFAAVSAALVDAFFFAVALAEALAVALACALAVALATFAICVAATLYPAWRAAQIAPVEALRYE